MANSSIASTAMINGHSAFTSITAQKSAAPNGGPIGLVISEMTHIGKLNIRCDDNFHKTLSKIVGLETKLASNRSSSTSSRHALWLAPDEILLLSEAGTEQSLAKQIDDSAGKHHISVNDITDALTALRLTGPYVRHVLAKGCGIDLHKDHFRAGDCAQTTYSHAAVTILALSDEDMILLCRTSFTNYTVAYLCDAALEYGFELKA